jgi:hypothetical protein
LVTTYLVEASTKNPDHYERKYALCQKKLDESKLTERQHTKTSFIAKTYRIVGTYN